MENSEDSSGWYQPQNLFKIPQVSQAHLPSQSSAVEEEDYQDIDGLPVGVDDDSRKPHISTLSPDLAAESDSGDEKVQVG